MEVENIFKYIDEHKDDFIGHLKEYIKVKSVSAIPEYRPYCFDMVEIVKKELEQLNCEVMIVQNPKVNEVFPDGTTVELPPIILATLRSDKKEKTLCIYGHLDVQPARKEDGWNTEPFDMFINGDVMIGRGTNDDKGPVIAWLSLLKAYKDLNIKPNINLKFVFECMEETGSEGLEELVKQEKNSFLKDVDYICISDNSWITTRKPCLTYGLRGISYYGVEVSGPDFDLHSGFIGGAIHEPMTDLVNILSRLVDNHGKIKIPGIYDQVPKCLKSESDMYDNIDFDVNEFATNINCSINKLHHKDKNTLLQYRWRYPSLSIHGIQGCFSEPGAKTVIPAKVLGKFSIRLVPNMDLDYTYKCVFDYIESIKKEINSPNLINLIKFQSARAWITDIKGANYKSAANAIKKVYKVEPDFTREGGSIPVSLYFSEHTGKSVILIPVGRSDDGPHSQNEKLNISNLLNGIKVFAAYIDELSK